MTLEDVNILREIAKELEAGSEGQSVRVHVDIAVRKIDRWCDKRELEILRAKMKIDEFELVECETIPPNIDDGKLYYSRKYGTATHLCACGCGAKVVTPCKPGFWTMEINDGKPTLSPSIGNFQLPCKSHYFIRDGKVVWC